MTRIWHDNSLRARDAHLDGTGVRMHLGDVVLTGHDQGRNHEHMAMSESKFKAFYKASSNGTARELGSPPDPSD